MKRLACIIVVSALAAGCGSSPSSPTPATAAAAPTPAGSVTQTFAGTISGGDATSCVWTGTPPFQLTNTPCSVFTVTVSSAGMLTASLKFNSNQSLLDFNLFDPSKSTRIVGSALDTSAYPNEAENLSTNIQPGTYQLQVTIISTTAITPFTISVTHP